MFKALKRISDALFPPSLSGMGDPYATEQDMEYLNKYCAVYLCKDTAELISDAEAVISRIVSEAISNKIEQLANNVKQVKEAKYQICILSASQNNHHIATALAHHLTNVVGVDKSAFEIVRGVSVPLERFNPNPEYLAIDILSKYISQANSIDFSVSIVNKPYEDTPFVDGVCRLQLHPESPAYMFYDLTECESYKEYKLINKK